MAAIRETLTLEDAFSANFTRYINLGKQAAGASELSSSAARNYQSVANTLDRRLIGLNAQFAVAVQKQQDMTDEGRQNTVAFRALDEQIEQLGSTIRNTQAQYDAITSQMEKAEAAAKEAASATEDLAESQNNARASSSSLVSSLKSLAGAYLGIQGAKSLLNLSDTYASNTARLNMMNDGLQTTAELQDAIYIAAQRSRGAYQATTDMVAKLGTLTEGVFDSNQQLVDFAEQLNKQIALSGASTQAADAAMLQLTQGLSSGVLRGEELNSILEQTPTIAKTIADYMGVTTGEMRELASEGQVTAEVVKNALLGAAEETNAKFAEMPMTWGQVWNSAMNTLVKASEPLLDAINWIANNLDALMPIIAGVAAAVGAYAIATGIWTAATWLANAANQALIATLLKNPILWIAVAIGVVIAALVQWAQAVGGFQIVWMYVVDAVLLAWDTLKVGFMTGVYAVLNFLDWMGLGFQATGVAVANFIGDMKVNVLTILQSMVNGAIDIINGMISAVNLIPGVYIEPINHVTFGTEAAIQNEAERAARAAGLEAAQAEIDAKAAARSQEIADMWSQRDADHNQRLADIETKRAELAELAAHQNSGTNDQSYEPPPYEPQIDGIDSTLSGIGASVSGIEKSVSMSEEDLKSLIDMAERRYVANVNLTSQTPVINVNGANTGNTEADRKALADAIQIILMEQISSTSARATAVPT